jgi:hypothetical protein
MPCGNAKELKPKSHITPKEKLLKRDANTKKPTFTKPQIGWFFIYSFSAFLSQLPN